MRSAKLLFPIIFILFSCFAFAMCSSYNEPVQPPDNGDGNGVPGQNDPPQAVMDIEPIERAYSQGQSVTFDASLSTDPQSNIATYEWDFHYNDSVFNSEATGPRLTYDLPSFGSVVAAVRVTDSGNPALTSLVRKRLNVKPTGEIKNVTNGEVSDFLLRKAVASGENFYILFTGLYDGEQAAFVVRSSDNGESFGLPVIVSDIAKDKGPLGIWMDAAPFGIVVAWMNDDGTAVKYTYGKTSGVNGISFGTPFTLKTLGPVIMHEAVLYSIACTPSGEYIFVAYMTADAYELVLITAKLNTSGEVTEHNEFTVKIDNDPRKKFSGVGVCAGPTGRGYLAYIWKSLGYDNDDQVYLYYFTPPVTGLEGPVRVDVEMTGFIFDHDPYVIANNDDEPIVYLRTTGIFQGGKDIALCISDGNPPVFRPSIRANNVVGGDMLAAQNSPSATFDRDHGHLWLAFEDFRKNNKVSQVYVAMFDDQYSTLLPDFDVSDDPALIYSDVNPQICFKSGANPCLLIAWERDGTDIVAYRASY